jgi:hypothetical protein
MVQEEIAKLLRTSKTAVNHNIRAFEAMKNKYMRLFPGAGAVRKFSYFLELYKKPELRDWVSSSPDAIDQFVQWVGTSAVRMCGSCETLCPIHGGARGVRGEWAGCGAESA